MQEKNLQSIKNEDRLKKCPDCGSKNIEYDHGELYCKKCGFVIEE